MSNPATEGPENRDKQAEGSEILESNSGLKRRPQWQKDMKISQMSAKKMQMVRGLIYHSPGIPD
jgi:hypothetical protein